MVVRSYYSYYKTNRHVFLNSVYGKIVSMNNIKEIEDINHAVERLHNCKASHIEDIAVVVEVRGDGYGEQEWMAEEDLGGYADESLDT